MKLVKKIKLSIFLLSFTFLVFFSLNLFYPLPVEKLNRAPSSAVFSQEGKLLRAFCSRDGYWRIKCHLDDISPFLKRAVITYEDRWFFWHPGINPFAIIRAAITNIKAGEIVCGGSTIPMQIARMMEPKPRTMLAKLIECFRALQLELYYSKSELLELYFNLVPYGGNIEGVATASYFYFEKSSGTLSRGEALLLVSIPNSPERLRPDYYPQRAMQARGKVAERVLKYHLVTPQEYSELKAEPLPDRRRNLPFRAPHFAELVRNKAGGRCNISTTIDFQLQQLCERSLQQHTIPLRNYGISNGAVVIIDNKTRAVRALVGSCDFFDSLHAGQVNGALAPRSPGSALKPFVYALALEHGLLSPKKLIPDVPVEYSGYKPCNYDETYRGSVTMKEALKLSLNVPAVNLYAKLGGEVFSFLKEGGISTLTQPRKHYGLPLILGACEVNLLELTNLYASLANRGKYQPYKLFAGEELDIEKDLLSEGTTYIITEILSEVRRPDLPSCWEFTLDLPKISWKTGTSYGHRDAWSIGYNSKYTIGVWIGNFSGKEAERLVGSEVAAPLLFDIFNAISKGSDEVNWFTQPLTVDTREVCALSGMLPTADCPQTTEELYIPSVSPVKKCNMHKSFCIDCGTGYRLCPHCRQGRTYRTEVFIQWPAEIASWRERENYPTKKIPSHFSACPSLLAGKSPIIISPAEGAEYYIRENLQKDYQKILLSASVSNDIGKIYWFIDGELAYTVAPNERVFYYPTEGRHKVVCVDETGRFSEVTVAVHKI